MNSIVFFVETRKSYKTSKLYTALWCDLGYVKKLISVDSSLIMEILNVTPYELSQRNEGDITYLNSCGKEK